MRKYAPVLMDKIRINGGYWGRLTEIVARKAIPYQWEALNDRIPGAEPSHAVENLRIASGEFDGDFHGMLFQDSDVAKWVEAACYSLASYPDPEMEKNVEYIIDLFGRIQQEDGYLNSYFTASKHNKRWTDFSHGHELYCAGHIIEAAVACFDCGFGNKLLEIARKYADYIDSVIGPEKSKMNVYCGHPEIELALVKLYRATGEARYLELGKYFIDTRGEQPCFLAGEPTFGGEFKDRWFDLDYHQAHRPVREQNEAVGHSVRAMYLYTAMADIALETGDDTLLNTLFKLWDNVTGRRMYITGGVGSQEHAERFTFDYDLPDDTVYAETCASIGLVFWSYSMLQNDMDSRYADVLERALYNCVLSGISLDGMKYFYVNPLEVYPEAVEKRYDLKHVKPERVRWYGCACCPPNIARLIASIGKYIYLQCGNRLYVNLYISNRAVIQIDGEKVGISLETGYPWDGKVGMTVSLMKDTGLEFGIALRIPGWCKEYGIMVNGETAEKCAEVCKGYIRIKRKWNNGDNITLDLSMPVEMVQANPQVRENAGKLALQRGPLVYCLEEEDNGKNLSSIYLAADAKFWTESADIMGGVVVIKGEAFRDRELSWGNTLYRPLCVEAEPVIIKAIPYNFWCNRTPGEMSVWIRYK